MCPSSSPGRWNFLLRADPRASAEKGVVVFTGHGQNDAGGHFHHETLGHIIVRRYVKYIGSKPLRSRALYGRDRVEHITQKFDRTIVVIDHDCIGIETIIMLLPSV